jgi:hypothetical protein
MHSNMIQQSGSSAGGPARAPSAAEIQAIDAQLELAAKKAALEGMQRASGDAQAPAAPAAPSSPGVITIVRDGRTITLDNPSPEQLAAVTGAQNQPDVSGWQLVAMTGSVVWGGVAMLAIFLWHRRRSLGLTPAKESAESASRMARIENAVESIAVEVERISEGQRYTSKLLSEGAAQPVNGAVNVPEILGAVLKNRGGG